MASRSPAYTRFQKRSLMTPTRAAPGFSSPGRMPRPSIGTTPMAGKQPEVTMSASTKSGSPRTTAVERSNMSRGTTPARVESRLRERMYSNDCHETDTPTERPAESRLLRPLCV